MRFVAGIDPRLAALALAPFAFGSSAFVFAGLLEPMGADLAVGVPAAGQLQTAFAIACGIGGPVLASRSAAVDRKTLLLAVLATLAVVNLASAAAPSYAALMVVRVLGGLMCALTLPLASTIAVALTPPERRAQALALVLAGYTLAFLVGVPLGTAVGGAFGWRASFLLCAGFAAVAGVAVAAAAPWGVGAVPTARDGALKAALSGDNAALMALTLLSFIATFATVAFIGPVVTQASGIAGGAIGAVQAAVGVGSLVGLPVGAALAARPARVVVPALCVVMAATQLLFMASMAYDLGAWTLPALVTAMSVGAGALFAMSPIVQSRLAETAGPAATLAFALNSTMIFFGQGLGAALGGLVAAGFELSAIGLAGALAALSAAALAAGALSGRDAQPAVGGPR